MLVDKKELVRIIYLLDSLNKDKIVSASIELISPSLAHMQSANNKTFFSVMSFPY